MAIKLQIKIFKDSFFYSRGLCGTLFTILGFSHILFVLYMGGGLHNCSSGWASRVLIEPCLVGFPKKKGGRGQQRLR